MEEDWRIVVKDTFNSITIRWIYPAEYLTFNPLTDIEMPSTFRSAKSNLEPPELIDYQNKHDLFLNIEIINEIGLNLQRIEQQIAYNVGEFSIHGIVLVKFQISLRWSHQSQPFYQKQGYQKPKFIQIMQNKIFIEPMLELGSWIFSPSYNVNLPVIFDKSDHFFTRLHAWSLFTLPYRGDNREIYLYNGDPRYCIDLTKATVWNRSYKVKRYAKDFKITVNRQFVASLKRLIAYHNSKHNGTWFTDSLLAYFQRRYEERKGPVYDYVFELWEGEELVAVTAGYAIGRAFHDYSMATFKRDKRNCGSLLTKTVGKILTECGYEIWYWGMKVNYMAEYDSYGGRNYSNFELGETWMKSMELSPIHEIAEFVNKENNGIWIKPLNNDNDDMIE